MSSLLKLRFLSKSQNCLSNGLKRSNNVRSRVPQRNAVFSDTGSVLDAPEKTQFGLTKALIVTLPALYLGANISKHGAAFLEENDIFVPDDDDD
ncbi:hypothetical protein CAPTEDRAFT_157027, partial [Capitella teleta]